MKIARLARIVKGGEELVHGGAADARRVSVPLVVTHSIDLGLDFVFDELTRDGESMAEDGKHAVLLDTHKGGAGLVADESAMATVAAGSKPSDLNVVAQENGHGFIADADVTIAQEMAQDSGVEPCGGAFAGGESETAVKDIELAWTDEVGNGRGDGGGSIGHD